MSARVLIILLMLLQVLYNVVIMRFVDEQRRKPLPEEVADVYDKERYAKFIAYKADYRKLNNRFEAIELIIQIPLLLSGIYAWIERICDGNLMLIVLLTYFVFWVPDTIISIIRSWISTFRIEEKYEMNRSTTGEFVKDTVISIILNTVVMLAFDFAILFVGENMQTWTGGYTLGIGKAVLLGMIIAAGFFALFAILQLISYFALRLQYQFTPMPEGPLLDKIRELQKDSKKKVKSVYIYNESKKSTSKNAFLLKLFWHREFGIADNFINENAEDELLAVLSHEIGHLKHKKNWMNYVSYAIPVLAFVLLIRLICVPDPILHITAWVRRSFGITVNNYAVLLTTYSAILEPLGLLFSIFGNYRSREEEYEADREAVKNGYGEAMITMFKQMSRDELVDVNPHPAIEFLEYDHPGMVNRFRAIRNAMQS